MIPAPSYRSIVIFVTSALRNNSTKLTVYLIVTFCCALLLSATFGQHYDESRAHKQGSIRKPRQVASTSLPLKDPYASRPRIQTRNGHLLIEASQDKNIDFKTSGSRGSITINGYKLDRLLDVTKALEKSAQIVGAKTGKKSQETANGPYDLVLRGLFESGDRFVALEKRIENLNELIAKLKGKLKRIEPRVLKKVSKLTDRYNSLVDVLKRNDCFDQETGQPNCKNGATCLDTYNGFKCLCPNNYEGATCEQDIDECAKFRNTDLGCQNGAKCVNLPGSYKCECTSQYHGIHCTEQHDDCALSSSKSLCGFGKCINLARTVANQAHYECVCDQGWTTDGANPACVIDINECLVGQSSVIGLPGSSNISFNSLQTSAVWSNSLMAAYPCSQNPFVDCVNLPGSFQCGPCPPGYIGNGRICRDLDECATNNGGCSTAPLVECINTQGSRRCGPCPPGYTGDGLTCKRETACSAQANGGCHMMARCIELEGVSLSSRLCVCKYPFVGEGVGVNGCRPLPGPTGPTFNSGGSGNNTDPAAQLPSKAETDCSPNPCLNMATCQLTGTSFECLCQAGFQGRICDEQVPVCGGRFFFSKGSMSFPQGGNFQELVKLNSETNSVANNFKPAATLSERHYNCNWEITVSSNMSIELVFSELTNKINPSKQVQLFLANATSAHQIVTPPVCVEYLDVRERLEVSNLIKVDENQAGASKGRLLARFCTYTLTGATGLQALSSKRSIVIMSESNMVDLDYSFAATRTQFGEPSLSFTLNWNKKEPPCGGQLPVAEFGSLSSPKFPEFYPAGTECRYLIRVPPGKRVRIQFGELTLLTGRPHSSFCSDSLIILDGSIGSDRAMIFKHCANNSTFASSFQQHSIAPIISSSSTVELILDSRLDSITPLMKPKQQRGFYLTYSSEPAAPGCGGLYTLKSAIIKSADYEPNDQPVDIHNSRLAVQMAGFLDPIDNGQSSPGSTPALTNWLAFTNENQTEFRSNWSRWAKLMKTRCEYEIRPADQLRNNKITLDWLEMPTAVNSPSLSSTPLANSSTVTPEIPMSRRFFHDFSRSGLTFPTRWSLLDRCLKGRLTVFDDSPSPDGNGRTEIASFCAGDVYNASEHAALKPIISSGHVLYLVYESSQNAANASSDSDSLGPNGFKLHYSTVCHAVYNQQSGSINVDLDSEVNECIYHIVLPPNNTISLLIEPKLSDSTSLLALDGTCSAQAIFLDGAVQWNSSKQAVSAAERQLKTYRFATGAGQSSKANNNQATRAGNTIDVIGSGSDAATGGPTWLTGETPVDSYWQYSSSQVHDIKEFEVCRLPALSFDSIWNHLSLLFRLKQKADERSSLPKTRVQLTVRYQAEPSCGGIITESPGSIKLEQSRRITSLNSFPITAEQYEKLHKQQFVNPCAWILQSPPNKAIQFKFEAPEAEIKKRYSDWLSWSQKVAKQTNSPPAEFNCSQVFQESIEIYEPSLNKTRYLCPSELLDSNSTNKHNWNPQSNVVFIRLHNTTLELTKETNSSAVIGNKTTTSNNSGNLIWPGKRPLANSSIVVKYKFVSSLGAQCGGRLLRDSGIVHSPRYPYNYPPRMNCVWTIQTDPKQQVRLNFTKFELENPTVEGCNFDYLELRNGPSSDSPLVGRFCGSELQSKVIVAHSSMMWLKFVSDRSFSRAGFEIQFDGAQTGCGGKLTSVSGQIDSPNYPLSYGHTSDCEWSIEVSQSNRIELTIVDLDLSSDSVNCSTSGAQTDYLELIDSANKDSFGRSLGRYCHKSQLVNKTIVVSRSNKLYIVYKSQALDNSRGFRLTYRTNCEQIELNGLRGAIETPGYPKSYTSEINCSWIIKGPLGSNLTLAISDMDLEEFLTNYQQTELLKVGYKETSICDEDIAEVWALNWPQQNSTNTSSNKSEAFKLEFEARPGAYQSEAAKKFSKNLGLRTRQPKGGKLIRTLCGQLSDLSEADRLIDMSTNMAYIAFETDRYVEKRGFRIEWRARGCGGQQVGDTIQAVVYHETANLQRPTECVWNFDMFKLAMTIEFSLHSDMRSPDGQNNQCDDVSLTVYDGPTDQAPVLSRNCDSLKVRESIITSSGQALVKFYTSGRHNYGRSFSLSGWPSSREGCLPSVFDINTDYNRQAGSRKSPNYPDLYNSQEYHCYGLLTAAKGRLRIRIDELNIPVDGKEDTASTGVSQGLLSQETCAKSNNYLLIRNMVGQNVFEQYCGKLATDLPTDMARATVVLEQETAWTEFVTKNGARGRWKFTYDRLCGSVVYAQYPQELSSPNYPLRPKWPRSSRNKVNVDTYDDPQHSENVCIWRISNSIYWRKPDLDKKLHLSIINFVESDNANDKSGTTTTTTDCLRIFEGVDLSIRKSFFNLTEIDALYTPKVKICKQSDLKHTSLNYISQGSEIIVMITGAAIAKFRVRPFENYCGGEFHLNKAEFASLNYPQPYAADLDCHYFILSSPGSRVSLKFLAYDLPEGEPADDDSIDEPSDAPTAGGQAQTLVCDNVDHIEIWQLPVARKIRARLDLVNKLVGTYSRWSEASFLVWNEINSSNASDTKSAAAPFKSNNNNNTSIDSKLSDNSTSVKTKSTISARLYQLAKVYHLFHETKYRLSEQVQEQSSLSLSAFYDNAKLIGRFCGKKAPNFATKDQILRDDILIRFRSHSPASSTTSNKQPKGFLAEYKIEYGGLIELGTSPTNGDDLQEGFIGSPMYPIQQMSNSSIRWNFVTKLDSVIQFDLVDLDLGSVHQECQDTLSVFDGLNPQTSIKLTDWCGHLSFKVIDKRRLDLNMNANLPVYKAFNQKVQSNLIRTIQTSSNIATVVFTNYRSNGSFLLRYRSIRKSNKTIDNEDAYYDSETPLESDELLRRANDRSGINEGRNASKLCSQTHRLSFGPNKNSSLVTLTSPNWPNAAPQDIECHWLVYTYENSIIKFAADPTAAYLSDTSANEDQYSWTHQRLPDACLDQQNNERRVFVAVHDGASPLAPMIARHCLPMAPVQFQSSGKHLLIRYVNAANNYSGSAASDKPQQSAPSTFNGIFRGTASIGACGGQYHVLNSERIRDRSTRDAQYENNLSCTYYLFAANQDRVLAIMSEMSEFELAAEPTNSDCSIGDYIEIRDLPILDDQMDFSRSITGRSLGRFCAGKKLEHIESPGSAISVEFKTDSKNTAKGWELYVMSTVPRLNCPRGYLVTNLDEPVGRLTSPNWPHGFSGKRHCKYHLVAPLNQTIKLTFVRLQRPLLSAINGQSSTQKCADNFHYLDDNEARMLRYDSRPLREPLSPLSGALLRQLVKEVPCVQNYPSKLASLGAPRFEKEDPDSLESQISDGSVTGMKKISLDEYWSYYLAAPSNAFTIETNSHILLLDYETKNLLPNEGFFAVYRTEISEKFKCSREVTYKIDSPSDVTNDNDRSSTQNNLIESYKFDQETSEKDDFIQCEWIIKSAANPFVVDYLDLSQAVISYKMKPTNELESVRITYFVYQVLEIPPIVENTTLYDDMVMRSEMSKLNEVCGLNRLYMSDQFSMQIMFACGNLTGKTKWTLLDYNVRQVSLRTKNLRLKSTGSQDNAATSPPIVYRGLRAYYYEKLCPQIEHIIGEGIRIRSHDTFPNTSYSPGICRWSLMLSGGDYELSFNQIQFRAPENFVNDTKKPPATCDISNSDLDYIEFRTSMEPDAPVLARFCIYNQMKANQKAVMLNMKSKIVVLFVAGVKSLQYGKDKFPFNSKRANDIDFTNNNNNNINKQQQRQVSNNFGFDLLVVRIRNESSSEFCQHGRRENIYSFFSNPEHDYYEATQANVQKVNFLYPKNTHCEVEMNLEEGFRFNMSFKTIFDLEQSKDCQNDYVQLDDLLEPGPETATTSSATIKPVSPKSRTTRKPRTTLGPTPKNDTRVQITLNRREPVAKRIGRWCGKTRPTGYFASSSNRVRLTFHSNERIEGKGFFLEYSKIKPPGSELASILSSIQVS